jgi:hypothetical protein
MSLESESWLTEHVQVIQVIHRHISNPAHSDFKTPTPDRRYSKMKTRPFSVTVRQRTMAEDRIAEYQHEDFTVVGKDARFGGFEILAHKNPSRTTIFQLTVDHISLALRSIPASSESHSFQVTTMSLITCMFLLFGVMRDWG